MSDVDAEHRDFVRALPTLRLTARAFAELPEYSATNPTGTTPGKAWKRLDGLFDRRWRAAGGKPRWIVCQYDPDCPPEAKRIRIFQYRPIIIVRARTEWGYEG